MASPIMEKVSQPLIQRNLSDNSSSSDNNSPTSNSIINNNSNDNNNNNYKKDHDTVLFVGSPIPLNTSADSEDGDDQVDAIGACSGEEEEKLKSVGNQFQLRKNASQSLMDVALMMANISQLQTLYTAGPDGMGSLYYFLFVLVVLSLTCQIIFGVLMYIIFVREQRSEQLEKQIEDRKEDQVVIAKCRKEKVEIRRKISELDRRTRHLNHVTMILVYFIIITNMVITGFGIKLNPSVKE